jgi:flagellar hook-length control protein FliK
LRVAANAHAAHIEGQQILNQVNLKRFDPPVPLYFSFPVKITPDETVCAEVQVWSKDENDDGQHTGSEEFGNSRLVLQTTIRLSPPRLGSIEVRLSGAQNADLNCQVLVEKPNAYRLLRRYAGELANGLSGAGWTVHDVNVGMAADFAPLWFGGAALKNPRNRVDKKA